MSPAGDFDHVHPDGGVIPPEDPEEEVEVPVRIIEEFLEHHPRYCFSIGPLRGWHTGLPQGGRSCSNLVMSRC